MHIFALSGRGRGPQGFNQVIGLLWFSYSGMISLSRGLPLTHPCMSSTHDSRLPPIRAELVLHQLSVTLAVNFVQGIARQRPGARGFVGDIQSFPDMGQFEQPPLRWGAARPTYLRNLSRPRLNKNASC